MKTDVGLKIIALVFFLAAGQPVLADEDAGKDAYVDSLMSLVRPMRDRGRLVPAAQEFMDFTADNITGENTSNKKNEAVVRTISGSSYNGFSVRCVKSIE